MNSDSYTSKQRKKSRTLSAHSESTDLMYETSKINTISRDTVLLNGDNEYRHGRNRRYRYRTIFWKLFPPPWGGRISPDAMWRKNMKGEREIWRECEIKGKKEKD